MKRTKRTMAAAVSVMLTAGLIAGCGNGAQKEKKGSAAETMKLQMLFDEAVAEYVNMDAPIVKELEKRYQVEFEPIYYASANNGFNEWLTTRIIGDEFPDMFFNSSQGASQIEDLVEQGLLKQISLEKLKEKCPDIYAWAEKYKDFSGGIDIWDYFAEDGKTYVLPYAWYEGAKRDVVAIRGDWLKNVGITKVPETIAEYEEAMRLFTEGDPDGDGKKNTYGYSHINDPMFGFNWIYPAFGTNPGHYQVDEDGKVTRGEIEEGSRLALEVLHRWYELGYIDPEWVTNGWGEAQNKIISGVCGITWQGYPAFCEWDGSYLNKLVEVNPDAYYEISPGPEGPDGLKGCLQFNPVNGGGLVFSADLSGEKLDKYLEIVNDLCFNKDLQLLLHRGVEGETYHVTDQGYEWLAPYDDLEKRQAAGYDHGDGFGIYNMTTAGCFRDPSFQDEIFYTKAQLEVKRDMESKTAGTFDLMEPFSFEAWVKNGETLGRISTDAYTKFITGERSLDEFGAYVDEWLNSGGADVLKEAQAKYDEMMK